MWDINCQAREEYYFRVSFWGSKMGFQQVVLLSSELETWHIFYIKTFLILFLTIILSVIRFSSTSVSNKFIGFRIAGLVILNYQPYRNSTETNESIHITHSLKSYIYVALGVISFLFSFLFLLSFLLLTHGSKTFLMLMMMLMMV